MQRLRHAFVWLKRIGHCRGFGVQSPTDYWLVRYVINEHWPYYQYASLGEVTNGSPGSWDFFISVLPIGCSRT